MGAGFVQLPGQKRCSGTRPILVCVPLALSRLSPSCSKGTTEVSVTNLGDLISGWATFAQ